VAQIFKKTTFPGNWIPDIVAVRVGSSKSCAAKPVFDPASNLGPDEDSEENKIKAKEADQSNQHDEE